MITTNLWAHVATWFVRIVLILTAIVQIGAFEGMYRLRLEASRTAAHNVTHEEYAEQKDRLLEHRSEFEAIFRRATADGSMGADEYFDGLIEIEKLSNRLGITYRGFDYRYITLKEALLYRHNESLRNMTPQQHEEYDRALPAAQLRYARIADPEEYYKRLRQNTETSNFSILPLVRWMVSSYVKCMPLAFVLFLLWMRDYSRGTLQLKERQQVAAQLWTWKAPVVIIAYPIMLLRVLNEVSERAHNRFYVEARVRQTKRNAFQRLSEYEVQLVAELASSTLSRVEVRARLRELGRRRQHLLLTACIAVLVAALITPVVAVTLTLDALVISDDDDTDSRAGPDRLTELKAVLAPPGALHLLWSWRRDIHLLCRTEEGHGRNPEHIPIG